MSILKNGILKFAGVALVAISVSACSSSWSSTNTTRSGAAVADGTKRPMNQIIITEEDITDKPYRVIGDIDVTVNKTTLFNADPTREMVNKEMREEAYKVGADAVVLVRYGTVGVGLMSWGSLDGKGRAVAFTE